ncbi:hypothetical protein ACP275_08G249600 [Erythranthe tilingii]
MSPYFLKKFVDYAIGCGIRHLQIRGYARFNFPAAKLSSFNSSTLKTLRLNVTGQSIKLPKHVTFPKLEALRLKNFQLLGKRASGEMIFAGCPKLQELILVKCWIRDGYNTLNVSCPNLKILEIREWSSPWERFHEQVIVVDAPCLVFFKFQGVMAKVDFKVDMPRLDSKGIKDMMMGTCKEFDEAAADSATDLGGLYLLLESSVTEESFRYTTWNCDGPMNLVKEVSRLMELKTKVEAANV